MKKSLTSNDHNHPNVCDKIFYFIKQVVFYAQVWWLKINRLFSLLWLGLGDH